MNFYDILIWLTCVTNISIFQQYPTHSFGKNDNKVFNVSYLIKLWALIWYMDNYKQHLNLIFQGIFFLHDSSVSSKILIGKTRSHVSIWFWFRPWKSKGFINLVLKKFLIASQNTSYLPKCFTNTPVNFAKFLKSDFLQNTSGRLLLMVLLAPFSYAYCNQQLLQYCQKVTRIISSLKFALEIY